MTTLSDMEQRAMSGEATWSDVRELAKHNPILSHMMQMPMLNTKRLLCSVVVLMHMEHERLVKEAVHRDFFAFSLIAEDGGLPLPRKIPPAPKCNPPRERSRVNGLMLRVEPIAGPEIIETIRNAIQLSKNFGVGVVFDCNDVEIPVWPESDPEHVLLKFHRDLKKRRERG